MSNQVTKKMDLVSIVPEFVAQNHNKREGYLSVLSVAKLLTKVLGISPDLKVVSFSAANHVKRFGETLPLSAMLTPIGRAADHLIDRY